MCVVLNVVGSSCSPLFNRVTKLIVLQRRYRTHAGVGMGSVSTPFVAPLTLRKAPYGAALL